MPIVATAGTTFFIGGVLPAKSVDFVAADFTSQVWVPVSHLEGLGTFGDTSTEITFDSLSQNRTIRLKGTRNAGNQEVVVGIDYADAGQIAILAAEKTPYDYAFKMVFDDAPEGGTPSQRLFIAKVMSVAEALDTANNVMKMNASLGINSNVVRVNATGG